MTDCTLRPQSFLILQPSQTTNTHVSPKSTISGWPRQSPSLLTPGSLPHSHCCYSGGIPVTGLLESPLATSLPPAVPSSTAALKKMQERHLWLGNPWWFPEPLPKSHFLGWSSESRDNLPQPICFCSTFPYSPHPQSAHESAKLAEFFFSFLPCLLSCFCLRCPLSHLH